MSDEIPVMEPANKTNKVNKEGETETRRYGEMTFREMFWKSRSKLKILLGFIGIGALIILTFKYVGWIIPTTLLIALVPEYLFLVKIVKVPSRLVMEYKRKLKHLNLFDIPKKLFRNFKIDPRTAKLTAGSNQFVFLCSNADLENYKLETSWAATANPFDFMVDEDAYMELALRYEKMAQQDIANIAIPQTIGYDLARKNSRRLDEHDFDNLPQDYSNLKKKRPTEAYKRLRDMKGVGKNNY